MNVNYVQNVSLHNIKNMEGYLGKIPGLQKFHSLDFDKPITFFTGENGTGKSTLLEAIAICLGYNPEGGSKNYIFSTNDTHSELYQYIKISRGIKREKDGFFLRAESFYNLATYAEGIELDFTEYGGRSLHQQSHGESFFNLINDRFRGNGLYILDEPEAALSLQKQLSLMIIINELVKKKSQFIIATHSPFLLAMPNAKIFSFDKDTPLSIAYEETEPYQIMSLFCANRGALLEKLFS